VAGGGGAEWVAKRRRFRDGYRILDRKEGEMKVRMEK
jgi:hypothetical protein